MKILVVGYGSMGKRRVRLLKQYSEEYSFVCVDKNIERIKKIKEDGLKAYDDLSAAILEKPDVAFVCTSPGYHAEIILQLIDNGIHVFTELNLISSGYEKIIEAASKKNVRVFMSNTTLYDKQIQAIMNTVGNHVERHTYLYHVGQYLPDWHPWESYKDFFVGKKETNGCREILAIQLPWIVKIFGKVERVSAIKRKNTDLDIDFNDTYLLSFEHENKNTGVFVCDVLSRKAVSYLEILGENTHVMWQGTPESLRAFDRETKQMENLKSYEYVEHMEGYSDLINEDQYMDEIKAFFDWIENDKKPIYSLEEDKYILDIIDKIEG